jgi:hypothetical protein
MTSADELQKRYKNVACLWLGLPNLLNCRCCLFGRSRYVCLHNNLCCSAVDEASIIPNEMISIRNGIKTIDDLAVVLLMIFVVGSRTRRNADQTRGVLDRFNVSRRECDALVLHARIKAGWILFSASRAARHRFGICSCPASTDPISAEPASPFASVALVPQCMYRRRSCPRSNQGKKSAGG